MSTPRVQTKFTAHWLVKCPVKGCDCRLHFDIPMIRENWTETHWCHAAIPAYSWEQRKQADRAEIRGFHVHQLGLHCLKHKRQLGYVPINGSYSETHICDSRCMNAIGPNCECSCGGANHGRGYHVELKFDLPKQVAA